MDRKTYTKPVLESLSIKETRLEIDIDIEIGLPGLS
jgi:hypothetical protein